MPPPQPAPPGRRPAGGPLAVVLAALLGGCGPPAAAPEPAADSTATTAPAGPAQIELADPVVTLVASNKVRFEVRYRFTRGGPNKYYLCEVTFPGTPNQGAKPMERWELKSEGVITDRLTLSQPPVQTFEIRVSEADSPQDGYRPISNVVSGSVK